MSGWRCTERPGKCDDVTGCDTAGRCLHPTAPASGEGEALRAEWRELLADRVFQKALLVTAGLMETQWISPECRANRTVDGAWDEAVRRLREIYDAQVRHDPTITLGITIGRATTRPEPQPEQDVK